MSDLRIEPAPVLGDVAPDDDLTHTVCVVANETLCGQAVSPDDELDFDTEVFPNGCVVCVDLDIDYWCARINGPCVDGCSDGRDSA